MDPISKPDRCACKPRTVINGKEYPPKMGQAVSGGGNQDGTEDGGGVEGVGSDQGGGDDRE